LNKDCSHLLVAKLAKKEKVLSALARGIPILDLKSYLRSSLEENRWILDEEELEQFDLGLATNRDEKVIHNFIVC
jgi:hypothetical protein